MSTRSTRVREPAAHTTARFQARARAARWRARRPALVVLLVMALLLGLAGLAWAGPLFVVRSVAVTGSSGAMTEAQAAAVRQVGNAQRGTALLRVDGAAVAARVRALPFVAQTRVERSWPSTLRLVVSARLPVAAVPRPGGGYRLVDRSGTAYQDATRAPRGVPVVRVPLTAGAGDALSAALTVLDTLPADLRRRVSSVQASTPDDVRMRLGGAQVIWGSGQDVQLKARVLADLVRYKARVYDVSSPRTPVVR